MDQIQSQIQSYLQKLPPNAPLYAAIVVAVIVGSYLLGFLLSYSVASFKPTFYPGSGQLYLLMAAMAKKTMAGGGAWKKQVRKKGFRLDGQSLWRRLVLKTRKDHVQGFRAACSMESQPDTLPLIYPAALMISPQYQLFTSPDYPFPAIGSVHVTNHTIIRAPLKADQNYKAVIVVDPDIQPAKKGSEVTFTSTLTDESGNAVWVNRSTYLVLHRTNFEASTPRDETSVEETHTMIKEDTWSLVVKDALRYAAASKDMNPIHQSRVFAKLFGFQGIIIHGMYMLARAAEECAALTVGKNGSKQGYPLEVSCKFVRPLVLPSQATFKVYQSKKDPSELRFVVLAKNGKAAMEGTFSSAKKK